MLRTVSLAALLLTGAVQAQAQAVMNDAFVPKFPPARVGAKTQLLIGMAQAKGDLTERQAAVTTVWDPRTRCVQILGGVQLDDKSRINGNLTSTTVIMGDPVNVCR